MDTNIHGIVKESFTRLFYFKKHFFQGRLEVS